ncbi:MAG: hypothetical protein WC279_14800 [Sulfurimonas sp.]|jgi:molybdopterin synthase catalytic subunit|uniref:hypothetical protein n=1 Tax=unclassified Sulfurimonas TaxID=2623549 RepID=UPI0008D75BAE|nr:MULTISPECIES: hypothetical protein [unclassified Sulfurimonas]MBS4068896.1 hypothetical protein [Sulfurimonas sp.]MDD3855934.1 hypothetical protein [Sulfurimonas sp.]OHE06314.1 MAG: hypothetical protein A2345_05495 [Sulfurimonas sp. RIFOXYB12_FULL_35_9]OHE15224.1 MAG: hypothetical protein A2329_04490 [Sulfurimonas sp. RIFOXYB2_FULL_37_5]
MKTLTIQVEDNFMNDFLNFVGSCKDKIKITKDKNLEYDPYFYERQAQLQQIRDDIKSGKAEMISDKDFWEDIDVYVSSLQK